MSDRKMIYLDDAIDALAYFTEKSPTGRTAQDVIQELPSAQPMQTDKDFEKQIHAMFDHIWDCEIEHPIFQDTVGELMEAVIQAHNNSAQSEIIRCKDCKYSVMTVDGKCKYCDIWFPDEAEYMGGNYYCGSAERRDDG